MRMQSLHFHGVCICEFYATFTIFVTIPVTTSCIITTTSSSSSSIVVLLLLLLVLVILIVLVVVMLQIVGDSSRECIL
jgi:hypothetical protein